ncbi:MAG: GGDEF domain-containing protein [Deltaproteobacteria bacterium]|nr:GGDEF domain-containing protein [Deltaproteobacteria bacterium]
MSKNVHIGNWPRSSRWPIAGALIGFTMPFGLVLLYAARSGQVPTLHWMAREVASRPFVYAYITLSSLVVFLLLGRRIGGQLDRWQVLSCTDSLTGLWNRRLLSDRIAEELKRGDRQGPSLAVLFVDVDRLKQINDGQGHAAGDSAICFVADCLKQTCRITDFIARYGGDEFAIVAPGLDSQNAKMLAERIRSVVSKGSESCSKTPDSEMSVSIGVVEVKEPSGVQPLSVLEAADKELHAAKITRNCVKTEVL